MYIVAMMSREMTRELSQHSALMAPAAIGSAFSACTLARSVGQLTGNGVLTQLLPQATSPTDEQGS